MLKHFFRTATRNLYRNRLYTVINTTGLALGLAISFIIFSWISFELSYDKFNAGYENIYRIAAEDEGSSSVSVSPAVKTGILNQIPEIETSARIFMGSYFGKIKVVHLDRIFTDDRIFFADPEIFNVFSFQFLRGDPANALQNPNSVLLTENTARKYFGDEDPVGKTIQLAGMLNLEITGILRNIPLNSHFHFDMLVSMKSHPWSAGLDQISIGSSWMFHTYFKKYPGVDLHVIEKKCNEMGGRLTSEISPGYKINFILQPLGDIHLRSSYEGEIEANNDIRYVYLFASIALLVILIAGINYINLTTAYSFARVRETGIKKIMGAGKFRLMGQHMGEAMLITLIALFISMLLVELIYPMLNPLTGNAVGPVLANGTLLIKLTGIALFTGFLSGIIPSALLSSVPPSQSLKMGNNITDRKSGLRKFLVIFQLVISLLLLVGTVVIHEQLNFMQHKKLGYDKSHVLILFTGYRGFDHEGFANALRSETGIISLTGSASLPSAIESNEYIDTPDRKQHWVYYNSIDKDFFSTLEINLIAGKDRVSNILPEQYPNKYVLNEAALREIGWKPEEAIGQEISIRHGNMEPGPVIGVIEDFHFQSLHFPIRPLVLEFVPENLNHLLVRIPGDHIQATIGRIKAQWKKFAGDIPFEYSFLDNEYDNLYKSETKTGKLFVVFAALSSLISMLGLFGLSSFTALKRSREIGIRKVFGASAFSIIRMFSGEFASLVLFSFVISAPLAWIFMTLWLKEFAYKVEINPVLLLMAGGLVMVLTLLTVGFHSIRAAHTNPVTTLKYE